MFWWDLSLSRWPTGFDTVGWVTWPVKIVSEMTYKVSSGTLNLYSLTLSLLHYLVLCLLIKGGPIRVFSCLFCDINLAPVAVKFDLA